mgnify:CR=1 FL=1
MIEGLIVGILEQGLIYGIMAMGVYITYTILDFPDLSVDGTFPLGIAICFVMINNGLNPWLALLAAFAAGCIAGMFTGIFNVKLRIRNLLCGILTMTALYSINYGIVGKASDFLSMDTTTIFSQTAFLFGNGHFALYSKFVVILVITLIAKFALDWYMRTKSGFLLRSVGDNEGLVITLAQNPGTIKIIGLAIANGLVALSGSIFCQEQRVFEISSGTGAIVIGLASVIIGTSLFKNVSFMKATTAVLIGSVIYKACVAAALKFFEPQDMKLITAVLFLVILVIGGERRKKVKKNARA